MPTVATQSDVTWPDGQQAPVRDLGFVTFFSQPSTPVPSAAPSPPPMMIPHSDSLHVHRSPCAGARDAPDGTTGNAHVDHHASSDGAPPRPGRRADSACEHPLVAPLSPFPSMSRRPTRLSSLGDHAFSTTTAPSSSKNDWLRHVQVELRRLVTTLCHALSLRDVEHKLVELFAARTVKPAAISDAAATLSAAICAHRTQQHFGMTGGPEESTTGTNVPDRSETYTSSFSQRVSRSTVSVPESPETALVGLLKLVLETATEPIFQRTSSIVVKPPQRVSRLHSIPSANGSTTAHPDLPTPALAQFGNASLADANASVASLAHRDPAAHTQIATIRPDAEAGDDGYLVNQYLLLQRIGSGSQGDVFIAEDTVTGEARAVKVIRRPMGAARGSAVGGRGLAAARLRKARQIEQEIAVMRQCRHRNIVALHEVIDDPDHDTMFLVLDYIDRGPIGSVRPDGTCTTEFDIFDLTRYARQISAGLVYLHSHGIVHRDIKPDNILANSDGTVCLADFGMAELFNTSERDDAEKRGGDGDPLASSVVWGTRGTVAFMAPELFSTTESQGTCGEAVDVWALGVTFYTLLFGRLPWTPGLRTNALMDEIANFDPASRIPCPELPDLARTDSGETPGRTPASAMATTARPISHGGLSVQSSEGKPSAELPTPPSSAKPPRARPFPSFHSSEAHEEEEEDTDSEDLDTGVDCPATIVHSNSAAPMDNATPSVPSRPRTTCALELADMWRSLLSDMLQVKPARRATTADVRNRVRAMTSVAEEANGSIDQVASVHGITALW